MIVGLLGTPSSDDLSRCLCWCGVVVGHDRRPARHSVVRWPAYSLWSSQSSHETQDVSTVQSAVSVPPLTWLRPRCRQSPQLHLCLQPGLSVCLSHICHTVWTTLCYFSHVHKKWMLTISGKSLFSSAWLMKRAVTTRSTSFDKKLRWAGRNSIPLSSTLWQCFRSQRWKAGET